MKKAVVLALVLLQLGATPVEEYLLIEKAYLAWKYPVAGAHHFFRGRLLEVLRDARTREIQTTFDYVAFKPVFEDDKRFICRFGLASGISVEVTLPREKIKSIRSESTGSTWTSGSIISIKGRLRKFYVSPSVSIDDVVLFFDDADVEMLPQKP